jgi:hypothetical protein
MSKHLGGFYFMVCYNDKLFDGKVSEKNIAKIIYLATFLDYETNKLVYYQNGKPDKDMTEQDIKVELGFKDKTAFSNFKKEMVNGKIMQFKEDGIYLSDSWFYKGKLDSTVTNRIQQNNGTFSRMYIDTIRQLYKQVNTRQHRSLGYLFRLLPFVDWEYNVISAEPNTGLNAVKKALTKQDIAGLLHVDLETYKKVEDALMSLRINVNDELYYVIGRVQVGPARERITRYVVNPLVYTGGHDKDKLIGTSKGLWISN